MPVAEDRFAAAGDPVVIVGMALEAPGGIDTAEAYWELLVGPRAARRVAAQRFQRDP
jgi:mycobactin polyketide synthetase MbtC